MTEEQGLRAYQLKEDLMQELWDCVDKKLEGEDEAVQDTVRMQLTEQLRYWK